MGPSHTATKEDTRESTAFTPAYAHSPSVASVSVWRLNEEKVVYPPQIPVMKNCRVLTRANTRPSGPGNVAKKPMMNDPETLTTNVPPGKHRPDAAGDESGKKKPCHAPEGASNRD